MPPPSVILVSWVGDRILLGGTRSPRSQVRAWNLDANRHRAEAALRAVADPDRVEGRGGLRVTTPKCVFVGGLFYRSR